MTPQALRDYISTYQGPRYSELDQDVLALAVSGEKSQGYFVEFGVMDGKFASNTYLLEKHHGWTGILAEPARRFHADINQNRQCHVDHRAVTNCTGQKLKFQEMTTNEGMSGLTDFFDPKEMHFDRRNNTPSEFYAVETVSLNDLLDQYQAPNHIDYISMDTEGSETAILEAFDFASRVVDLWTVEHNHCTAARNRIWEIMTDNGFRRVLDSYSRYDDWYIKKDLLK